MQDRAPVYPGRVKLVPVSGTTDTFDLVMADEPLVEGTPPTTANLLTDATASLQGLSGTSATVNNFLATLSNVKAPNNHASTATTYGIGTSANYGHNRLSDSVSTTSGASAGISATPTAVKTAYDLAALASARALYYGTCATTADTVQKIVVSSGFSLISGARIAVTFTYSNTVLNNPTLNVNGTGAITIRRLSNWEAGATVIFMYDGTYWRMVDVISQKNFYGTSATASATSTKVVVCTAFPSSSLIVGTRISILFNYANTASAPTLNVNGTGSYAIYLNGVAGGKWNAGQTIDFIFTGSSWSQVNSFSEPIIGSFSITLGGYATTVTLGFYPRIISLNYSLNGFGFSVMSPFLNVGDSFYYNVISNITSGTVTVTSTSNGFTATSASGSGSGSVVLYYVVWQ